MDHLFGVLHAGNGGSLVPKEEPTPQKKPARPGVKGDPSSREFL